MLVLAGLGILATGGYFASQLFAQQPGAQAAAAMQGSRIAVVNIGLVFNKYKRAVTFKTELEETLKPYKEKGKKLTDEISAWHKAMQDPKFDGKERERYEAAIRHNKRQLEDMQLEIQKLVGKRQEDNLVTLWKEVKMGIEAIAKGQGTQLVLGYGDPMEKEMLDLFPNINRKMQAMDVGGSVPLYIHSSVDISEWVADTLNKWASK
jgi:Skp family chaperone for outer membrane proteins